MPTYEVTSPDGKTWEVTAPEGATQDQVLAYAKQQWAAQKQLPKPEPLADRAKQAIKQGAGDLAAGAVRGAGSIGATLLAPIDAAARALNDGKPVNVGGYDIVGQDRRAGMDAGLREMGANPDSLAFKTGKLGAEVAGTMGAGGAVSKALSAIPGVAARAPAALDAIRTAGFSAGGKTGAAGLATRMVGGGVAGGSSAGLVNPDDAAAGVMIGAALPPALQLAGKGGQAVGRVLRGPEQTPELKAAVEQARALGYVIPPTQAKPTLANRVIEGFSGKITTAQNASAKNQAVTNRVAAQAIGLPADTKLTPDTLKSIRDAAGQAYDAIGQAGTVTPGKAYATALDAIEAPFKQAAQGFPGAKPSPVIDLVESLRSPQFDASSAIAKIKELRSAADDAFRAGNSDVGRASRAGAKALEDALESHLQQTGATDLLKNFRDARQLIAKTYTVEKALNPTSGSVDARKLAADLKKGKPLTGELKQAAEFGAQFPKAAQPVEGMGSLPQTSPLDWAVSGSLSAAMSNPLAMAMVAARPAARALALSGPVQNRLAQQPNALAALLSRDEIPQFLLRSAPVAVSDR